MRRSSIRLYSLLLLCSLVALSAASGHAQPDGAGLMTAGPLHVRALEGNGWGGQVSFIGYLPVKFLAGTGGVGARVWVAELEEPNSWNRNVRMHGVGIRWRTHWSLANGRLLPHVIVPVELLWTDGSSLDDLVCLEVVTQPSRGCPHTGKSTSLGAGLGGGIDFVVSEGFALSGGMTAMTTGLSLSDGLLWSAALGLSVRVFDAI